MKYPRVNPNVKGARGSHSEVTTVGFLVSADTSPESVTETIFARIARGDLPATIVYEDDRAIAFADVTPQAPTQGRPLVGQASQSAKGSPSSRIGKPAPRLSPRV